MRPQGPGHVLYYLVSFDLLLMLELFNLFKLQLNLACEIRPAR